MQKRNFGYAVSGLESAPFTASSEFIGTQWDFDSGLQNQPEKRLMLAILLDAVECFQKYAPLDRRKPDRLFKATEEWIFEDDYKWPFSFLNICDAVGIDPRYLRNGLQQWNNTQSRKGSSLKVASPIKIRRCA
jgi:hypothetical protein